MSTFQLSGTIVTEESNFQFSIFHNFLLILSLFTTSKQMRKYTLQKAFSLSVLCKCPDV